MVRRQDALEGQFTRLEREKLRALEGSIAGVRKAVERLLSAKASSPGQPDWIGCREPEAARDMLLEVDDWCVRYAEPLGVFLIRCWPWHPSAVAVLLAAMNHHTAVMAGDVESGVTDFLTRVLPTVATRVHHLTAECNDYQHRVAGAWFSFDAERLVDVAHWWATDRLGLAPGLAPWDDRDR